LTSPSFLDVLTFQDGQPFPDGQPFADAVLADGTVVGVRLISADDEAALAAFHDKLSAESVYRRFFGIHRHLSPTEVQHFCRVDNVDRLALVGVTDGEIVGVARMERIQPATTAEVAFVIADEIQHRGLGRIMAQRLAVVASALGITEFVADTLVDNRAMLHLLTAAGFAVTMSVDEGVARLVCPIT
jgi:RimJ/RimL family protein N-acetyltransferase